MLSSSKEVPKSSKIHVDLITDIDRAIDRLYAPVFYARKITFILKSTAIKNT